MNITSRMQSNRCALTSIPKRNDMTAFQTLETAKTKDKMLWFEWKKDRDRVKAIAASSTFQMDFQCVCVCVHVLVFLVKRISRSFCYHLIRILSKKSSEHKWMWNCFYCIPTVQRTVERDSRSWFTTHSEEREEELKKEYSKNSIHIMRNFTVRKTFFFVIMCAF